MAGIKAILFDLGKVLVGYDVRTLERGYSAYGYIPEGVMTDYMMTSDAGKDFMEGRSDSAIFFEETARQFDLEIAFDEFYRIWNSMFYPYPEMEKLVREIKTKYPAITLVLVSDTNEAHFRFLHSRYEHVKLMDKFVLSYRVGRMKPSSLIYNKAVAASGSAPGDVLYIDDRKDLTDKAAKLGIRSFQFTDCTELRGELAKLGVKL